MSGQRKEREGRFWQRGLSDFQLEVMLIEQTSGALANHSDGDVASLDACSGELEAGVSTDAVRVVFESIGK